MLLFHGRVQAEWVVSPYKAGALDDGLCKAAREFWGEVRNEDTEFCAGPLENGSEYRRECSPFTVNAHFRATLGASQPRYPYVFKTDYSSPGRRDPTV